MADLVSFDIDGTLEFGDPRGSITTSNKLVTCKKSGTSFWAVLYSFFAIPPKVRLVHP